MFRVRFKNVEVIKLKDYFEIKKRRFKKNAFKNLTILF
jgi:hypothetical protein